MQSRTYIIVLIAGAVVLVGYLYVVSPDTAGTQLPAISLAVLGFAGILAKQGETEAKVDDNTKRTEQVHTIVNSQRTEMEGKIKRLDDIIEGLRLDRAAVAIEQKNIDANRPGLRE